MAKIQALILIFALTLLLTEAVPQRQRTAARLVRRQQRTRVLARQEVAPTDADAVTPYPAADELKPDVPFEEAPAAAEEVVPQPDEVYGPPETTLYNSHQPDEVYGPPEVGANDLPTDPAAEQFPPVLDEQQRLVAARKTAALRQRQAAYRQAAGRRVAQPAKLRAPVVKRRV